MRSSLKASARDPSCNRRLLASLTAGRIDEKIFDIVNQFNHGAHC